MSIKREDLGNLDEGAVADIAVLSMQNGKFGFIDAAGNRLEGKRKLEAELTIRAGKIVWDLNGYQQSHGSHKQGISLSGIKFAWNLFS